MNLPRPVITPAISIERSDHFYVESLYICVGNTLFDVPRYYFERHCDLISIISPQPREKNGPGWSKDNPIRLKGFTDEEFKMFCNPKLGVLMVSPLQAPKLPRVAMTKRTVILKKLADWESVLKVATLLGFQRERTEAIMALSPVPGKELGQEEMLCMILLARTYRVGDWLFEMYYKFATRKPTLSDEEAEVLGFRMTLVLLRLRDKGYKSAVSTEETLRNEVKAELARLEEQADKGILVLPGEQLEGPSSEQIYGTQYIVLKVNALHFRVPARILTEPSEMLWNQYKAHTDSVAMGCTQGEMLVNINDFSVADLNALLHAIWPRTAMPRGLVLWEDCDYWVSVLKLSTKWGMEEVRTRAIDALSNFWKELTEGTEMEQVALARKYGVRRWLMKGYMGLANRVQGITAAEGAILGLQVMIGLIQLRDVHARVKKRTATLHQEHCLEITPVTLAEVEAKFPDEGGADILCDAGDVDELSSPTATSP